MALPSALEPGFIGRLVQRELLVGLDFDGTLAPIAPRPELASLSTAMRHAVEAIREHHQVAIISGRGLADVRGHVGVKGVVYGGCHGMQIEGPGVAFEHEEAAAHKPALRAAESEIRDAIAGIDGAIIESKGLAVAVHRRNVHEASHPAIEAAVAAALRPGLRRKKGKMVDELVPDVDWDKGRALLWLRERLGTDLPTLYLGDDVTDEDAFRVLAGDDLGILVSDAPRPTAARRGLPDPAAVCRFLEELAVTRT